MQVRGSEPLTYQELEAWKAATKSELEPFETEAVFALDRLHWEIANKAS